MGRLAAALLFLLLAAASGLYGWLFAANAPHLMMPFTVPPALLTLFLIWALPAGDYAPTKAIGPAFWAFFVALVLWPNYLAIALPGLPWLTLVRISDGPLVLMFLISVSVSKPFRSEIATCLKDTPVIWKSLAIYIGIVTVTLPMAGSGIGDTVNKYLVFLTNQVSIFFISAYFFMRPRRLEFWVYLLLAMAVLLSLIGLWEDRLGYIPWAGHVPSFLKIEDDTVNRILAGSARAAVGVHRVQTVSTTPLGLAEVLGLSTPFALHVALGRYPLWLRVSSMVVLPLIIDVIILTGSRLGLVGILVAGALYLLLRSLVRWREVRGSLFGPAIVLGYPAIFVGLVASTLLIHRVRAKVWGDGSQDASNEGRKIQWLTAIPKIARNPIGHGYGHAAQTLGTTNAAGVLTIDSYWLNLLLDTGILGFVAYMTLFLGAAWMAAKQSVQARGTRETRLLMPLSVTLVAFVIIKAVFSQDANHPLVFIMLGAIAVLIHRSRQAERTHAAIA